MRVLKIVHDAYPEYPMYVRPNLKEVLEGIKAMVDGNDVIDYPEFDGAMGDKITISIELTEIPETEFEALEPWEL